jgi:hypothetical protein
VGVVVTLVVVVREICSLFFLCWCQGNVLPVCCRRYSGGVLLLSGLLGAAAQCLVLRCKFTCVDHTNLHVWIIQFYASLWWYMQVYAGMYAQ